MEDYSTIFPKPLLNDIVTNRSIPVIGAGFSKNAVLEEGHSMPSWDELGKLFHQLMPQYIPNSPLDILSAYDYKFKTSKLIEELEHFLFIEEAKPGPAHSAFARLHFDKVITTNFDFLLERSYSPISWPFTPVIEESQLSTSLTKSGTQLIKIHGDLNHPDRLIATEAKYDTFLNDYPLLATYISNLLISRTPVFIGYSMDDPDFRQLWKIIGDRLGSLRRPAYSIMVDIGFTEIDRFDRRGIEIINLAGPKQNYGAILASLFEWIKNEWNDYENRNTVIVSSKNLAEIYLPRKSTTHLCFFAIHARLSRYYESYVFPIVEGFGMNPITSFDVVSPGDNFEAKISALIEKAELVVIDISVITSPYDIWAFLGKTTKRTLIIIEEGVEIPEEFKKSRYLIRPFHTEVPTERFLQKLRDFFEKFSISIQDELYGEPLRLLDKKEYRAAVISAMTLIESELREKLGARGKEEIRMRPTSYLVQMALHAELLSRADSMILREWLMIRNRLVHDKRPIEPEIATQIVTNVIRIVDSLRNK